MCAGWVCHGEKGVAHHPNLITCLVTGIQLL